MGERDVTQALSHFPRFILAVRDRTGGLRRVFYA
jgi:hypothetical protein